MRISATVCDVCGVAGDIECRMSIAGEGEAPWDVCVTCYDKPFRRPTPSMRAEAKLAMANLLHGMADGLRAA